MHPTSVVVDTRDGYVFRAGSDGELFTLPTARQFAGHRNEGLNEPTYEVFMLARDYGPTMGKDKL